MTTTEDEEVDGASLMGIIDIPPLASGGGKRDRWMKLVDDHEMLLVPAPRERMNPFTGTMVAYPPPGLAEIAVGNRRVGTMVWFDADNEGEHEEIHVHAWPEDHDAVGTLAREVAAHLAGTYRVLE